MKRLVLGVFFIFPVHACILRTIENSSKKSHIVIRNQRIQGLQWTGTADQEGSLVPSRTKHRVDVGIGEYVSFLIIEQTSTGSTCKKYRITVDEANKTVLLEKKDGCLKGRLDYETIWQSDNPLDMKRCIVDLYVTGDANSASINAYTPSSGSK